jgi:hypothetical protein
VEFLAALDDAAGAAARQVEIADALFAGDQLDLQVQSSAFDRADIGCRHSVIAIFGHRAAALLRVGTVGAKRSVFGKSEWLLDGAAGAVEVQARSRAGDLHTHVLTAPEIRTFFLSLNWRC